MHFNWPAKKTRHILFWIALAAYLNHFRYVIYRPIFGGQILSALLIGSPFERFNLDTPTKIFEAAERGNLKTIKSYIRRGGSSRIAGNRLYAYQTLLHWAGSGEVAEYLISKGANIHAQDELGQTPLHTASSEEVAEVLLKHGADPYDVATDLGSFTGNRQDIPMPLTPSHTARSKDIAKVLAAYQPKPLCSDNQVSLQEQRQNFSWCTSGITPLHLTKSSENVKFFIEQGFDPNAKSEDSTLLRERTPLHQANTGEVAQALLENGAKIDAKTERGLTPLHTAKSVDVANVLIQNGADINAQDDQGRTPLHTVASWDVAYYQIGDPREISKLLLENGLDINKPDKQGRTPLHLAMEIMTENCLSPRYKAKGYEGFTSPIGGDPCVHNTDLAEFLIENGADIEAKDHNGQTPLFYTTRRFSNTQAAGLLIKSGADINARDNRGNTPLIWFANYEERQRLLEHLGVLGNLDIKFFRLLLEKGADIHAQNNDKSTVLQSIESLDQKRFGDLKKLANHYGKKESK